MAYTVLCLTNPRPSSTRKILFSARPAAPNAPDAPFSAVTRPMMSATIAVLRCSCADSSAAVTESTVSAGAPASRRYPAASLISACCPNTPSSAAHSSSAGNSESSE
jgi:hypothetical protein